MLCNSPFMHFAIKKLHRERENERARERRGKINGWFFCPPVPYNIWFLGAYLFPQRLSIKAIESKRQFIISERQLLKHQALPGTASPQDLHRCNQSAYENKKLMHPDWSTPFLIYFSFRLERIKRLGFFGVFFFLVRHRKSLCKHIQGKKVSKISQFLLKNLFEPQ